MKSPVERSFLTDSGYQATTTAAALKLFPELLKEELPAILSHSVR
jgi:hypothetical protein